MKIKRSIMLTASIALAGILPVGGLAQSAPEAVEAGPPVEVSSTGSYIVIMHADPLLGEFEQDELESAPALRRGEQLEDGHEAAMEQAGVDPDAKVQDFVSAVNGFSAVMSHEDAQSLAMQKDVAFVVPDELRQLTTDESPAFLGLDDRQGLWKRGYDGDGVVIGIIDSGIWPEHPSLADDGSYPAPPVSGIPCDFGGPTGHAPGLVDAPFTCNNKLIGARHIMDTYLALTGLSDDEYDSARDEDGHGTHTATTAGGNAGVQSEIFGVDRGVVSGIAPRAHIVAYKALGELGGYGSDLAAAIDQAVVDGVDVINYSIGSSSFAIGPDDVAFLFAADAGVHVATSGGNDGPGAATLGSPSSVPWLTTVAASTHSRTFEGSVTLGNGSTYRGASVTAGTDELQIVDAADYGNELCVPDDGFTGDVTGLIVLCKRGVIARVDKSEAVFQAGGAGMVLYNENDAQSEVTDLHFVPSVHINNTDGLAVKAYIAAEGAAATAQIAGGVYTKIDAPSMASFSSRGPNLLSSDIVKPDVTAPGVNILAGHTPTPTAGAPGQLFQSISGTSMSSPHVAGLMALIDQAHPDWTPAMVKSALMTTAYQDVVKEDGVTPADPFDIGAGHVDPSGPALRRNSIIKPGLVYDAGLFEYAAFTCGADLGVFTSGTCDFLEGEGIPMDPSDLNVPSIGVGELAGSQVITRTVTNVTDWGRLYKPKVEAPAGYDVQVYPRKLRVPAHQSKTFKVVITNTSAPVGEWSFGSLTWVEQARGKARRGGYRVQSPIAVRAVTLAAPDSIAGAIGDGGTSFDVQFGYSGPYSAAPHGLVPATVDNGTVAQDPDQTFDPSDVATGGAVLHEVETSGDALLRIHVPPIPGNPDIDLDMFVFDPTGAFYGASTNGGTDETVEVVLPIDGTWSIFVHGWGVGDPDASPPATVDYEIDTWAVSATPGGSLALVSAPASASLGATGTVEVSWPTDLASGSYLGAVSHTTADGLAGLTVVEVDG